MSILRCTDDLLATILSGLDDPKDLAALSLQCRRLKQLTHDSPVWQCMRRWTSYGIPWDLVDGYGWAETYRQLDALPDVVVRSVGKACQENSKKWREIRDGIIDEWMPYAPPSDCWELHLTMKAVFNVGLWAAAKDAHVLDGYAAAVLRRVLHRWLSTERSYVVSAFAENLRGWKFVKPYSRPESPEVMDELAWQRSAVEFLPEVVARGKNPARYASVPRDVANEAANFDAWCRAELVAGGVGEPQPPPLSAGYWWGSIDDVPEGHWWWRVTAAPGYGLEEDFWDGESDSALETSVSDSA